MGGKLGESGRELFSSLYVLTGLTVGLRLRERLRVELRLRLRVVVVLRDGML